MASFTRKPNNTMDVVDDSTPEQTHKLRIPPFFVRSCANWVSNNVISRLATPSVKVFDLRTDLEIGVVNVQIFETPNFLNNVEITTNPNLAQPTLKSQLPLENLKILALETIHIRHPEPE
ncbi:hypothetical protein CDAR_494281 [Caerostris darwini]|uniref:Uncharacterized protein n=1 Tax=Caerostris darwini TaxID=1538125 RepID=A0AAV4TNU1_9ARAC|nr:hypothetical protein CDAR_494281 [Caerostris darwini]